MEIGMEIEMEMGRIRLTMSGSGSSGKVERFRDGRLDRSGGRVNKPGLVSSARRTREADRFRQEGVILSAFRFDGRSS